MPNNVSPEIGQVWRGIHPRYGFGHFRNAEIIEITERHIILKWLDGSGTHHSTPEIFGQKSGWELVEIER